MNVRVGTSGWSYDHWDDVLYPRGLPARDRLDHYTQVFDTTELNASFYRWPKPATFAGWVPAYTIMSGAELPCVLRATGPFVYLRLHGPDHDHLYGGSYSDADLGWWAERIWEWRNSGKDVWVYFNNDGAGHAVRNASRLRTLLGS